MMENSEHPAKLLSPSEALNRFIPTEQLGAAWTEQQIEQSHYTFTVGGVGLIADINSGSEVITEFNLCAIPNTPVWFAGMVNLRGNLIPVFDLSLLFNKENKHTRNKYIIIIGKQEQAAGILVEKLPAVLRNADTLSELPDVPEILKDYVHTAYKQGDAVWFEFEHEPFFYKIGNQIIN